MNSGYLHFPEFDPVIFSVGPVSLHWYGLMYLVGFIFAMWLAGRRASRPGSGWTKNEVENLLYAGFLGVFVTSLALAVFRVHVNRLTPAGNGGVIDYHAVATGGTLRITGSDRVFA